MRIGILTGGGDCPGLNAVIRGATRAAEVTYDSTVIGFRNAWRGVMDNDYEILDVDRCRGILPLGGTILGTSRDQPFAHEDGLKRVRKAYDRHGLDAIIGIGGEGSMGVVNRLHENGFPVIGVPKTIDNDISLTEMTFGFQTAVQICTDAIDRLHTTAESHHRVLVVEVMGRHVGHIAIWSGLAGGAAITIVPEEPFDIDEVCERIVHRHKKGRFATIVVVAEGALPKTGTMEIPAPEVDKYGHKILGGIGSILAREIQGRTGIESRMTALGHIQRGGSPVAFDRVLGTRFGVAAVEAALDGAWGQMVALQKGRIERVPVAEAIGSLKMVDADLLRLNAMFQPRIPGDEHPGLPADAPTPVEH
ncbi:6-phosphofructokinase [Terrabacter aerolatus]|uniref:ATP-dependent 6-phosphofructokinase n=1 Tax=Terrabacter aerolatus TaxID=422442 RepID=A0A512CVW2_9MICO|nr:ATP-dependent 6-phosphofructokinase [Terrabacter aerolatus]GEO28378.1 pyrophosphate--fructose 6-phosphate 1-phosphotransferase [Terrabacter aerolatus]